MISTFQDIRGMNTVQRWFDNMSNKKHVNKYTPVPFLFLTLLGVRLTTMNGQPKL